jgi:ribosomal-protein-alanine N-acetyltransferase
LNSVLVRFASKHDLEAIYGVEDESFSDPYPHNLIAKLLRDCPTTFFVAECSPGIIAGYCVASEKGKSAHLISIGVLRMYRRRGVGTALIQRLLASLNARVKELRLEVKRDNREAIVLYEELGFKQVGLIDHYYQDGSTAVKMTLALKGTGGSESGTE